MVHIYLVEIVFQTCGSLKRAVHFIPIFKWAMKKRAGEASNSGKGPGVVEGCVCAKLSQPT